MNQEKIGRFLKQLRMEKQLTQEKLSETLGVSRRTVSRRKGHIETCTSLHRTEEEKNHAPNAYSVYHWMYFHGVLSFDSVFRTRTVNTII